MQEPTAVTGVRPWALGRAEDQAQAVLEGKVESVPTQPQPFCTKGWSGADLRLRLPEMLPQPALRGVHAQGSHTGTRLRAHLSFTVLRSCSFVLPQTGISLTKYFLKSLN